MLILINLGVYLFLFVYFIYFGGEWWREVGQITRSHWESDSANQLGLEIVASFSPMFRRKKMPMNWIQRSLYLSWSSLCEYFCILKENRYHKNKVFVQVLLCVTWSALTFPTSSLSPDLVIYEEVFIYDALSLCSWAQIYQLVELHLNCCLILFPVFWSIYKKKWEQKAIK